MVEPNPMGPTRAGYVALVGRPNVGKSTLLNRFVGQKLSIVSPKAQTTWRRVTGIASGDTWQMIFLDTPGILEPETLFDETILGAALEAVSEADVLLLLVDATRFDERGLENVIRQSSIPPLLVINKVDVAADEQVQRWVEWGRDRLGTDAFPISAVTGKGVEELRVAIESGLPESPFLYPPDIAASDPVRFFAAEMVRETIFERYRQEIPYSVFCQVEEFRENQEPVYIQINVYVDRPSQKRILVGNGGSSIRALGSSARKKIEELIDRPVYLDLWIKVLPNWRKKVAHLKRFGFSVPEARRKGERG